MTETNKLSILVLESRNRAIFCQGCGDIVYDDYLNKTMIKPSLPATKCKFDVSHVLRQRADMRTSCEKAEVGRRCVDGVLEYEQETMRQGRCQRPL